MPESEGTDLDGYKFWRLQDCERARKPWLLIFIDFMYLHAFYAVDLGVPSTLHWDGDALLFVSDAAGNVVDFKVGTDGETAPSNTGGVTVYDRDTAGVVVMTSNATGNSGLQPLDSSDLSGPSYPATGSYQPPTRSYFNTNRADGYNFGTFRINGVRAFDAKLGSWTTPDAYDGEIRDPASQQRYMWNRNNPYEYSDPSGYDTISMKFRAVFSWQTADLHSYIEIKRDNGKIVRYSFGPRNNKLHSMPQSYDDPKQHHVQASQVLASCKGTCTMNNGGFDESSLSKTSDAIDKADLTYHPVVGPNSNSGAQTACAGGGGGAKCNPKLPWTQDAPASFVIPQVLTPTGH